MKVKELIEQLTKLDQELELIYTSDGDCLYDYENLDSIEMDIFFKNENDQWYSYSSSSKCVAHKAILLR